MPYDPRNPDEFRTILKKLAKVLSSEKAIQLVKDERAAREKEANSQPFSIDKATLNRFRANQNDGSRKAYELHELWRVLEKHPVYCDYFPTQTLSTAGFSPVSSQSLEEIFVTAMTSFFTEPTTNVSAAFDLYGTERLGDQFVGSYAFYRPSRRRFNATSQPRNIVSISLLTISKMGSGFSISEIQDIKAESPRSAHPQTDRGCLVSLGKYLYFLMKEKTGTSVKFGVFSDVLIETAPPAVEWFGGHLSASSTVSHDPQARFFCRRIRKLDDFFQEELEINQIRDDDARAYLSQKP